MKQILVLLAMMAFASCSQAADFPPNFSIETGDSSLNSALNGINQDAATEAGPGIIERQLTEDIGVSAADISFLRKRGFCLAEIYQLGLLAKGSKWKIRKIAELRSKGTGWSAIAGRLKVKPAELNKLRRNLTIKPLRHI